MFQQSQPYPHMIDLLCQFKQQYGLRTVAVSNEGKELTSYRVQTFHLKEFIDTFIFSCYVGLRKPDLAIYHLAINISQLDPHEIIYIDDRLLLVEIAENLGMKGIHHINVESTQKALEEIMTLVGQS
jgi:putative hydrolase of the HAD superfamily